MNHRAAFRKTTSMPNALTLQMKKNMSLYFGNRAADYITRNKLVSQNLKYVVMVDPDCILHPLYGDLYYFHVMDESGTTYLIGLTGAQLSDNAG